MRRVDREVTDRKDLEDILRECSVVHIGLQDEAGLFVVPMNYGFALEEGTLTLYLHSAQEGRKAAAFRKGGRAAFEMDCGHGLRRGDTACGHSYFYRSVMGSGAIRELTAPREKEKALRAIMEHMAGTGDWEFPDAALEKTAVFVLEAAEWTGKENRMKKQEENQDAGV